MSETREKFFAGMQPREIRATAVITTISMMRLFALFALLPVMALYAGSLPGATPTLIGVAVGGYGLTQALLQIPLGALSDRLGRAPVLLLALAVFAAGSVLGACSDTIYGVIAGRLLQGAGAVSATLTALLADVTRPEIRTRTMALLGIGIGSTFLLALVAGPVIAAMSGVRALFWLGAALALVAAAMLRLLPPGSGERRSASRAPLRAALRPELLRLDAYIFVLHALLSATFVVLPFLLESQAGIAAGSQWKVYAAGLIVSLAGTLPLILADERKGRSGTMTIAILPATIGLALFFAGFNFLEAGLPARLSILSDERIRGASLGVFSSAQFAGIFVGGLAGGWLLELRPPDDILLIGAAVAAAWLLVQRFSGPMPARSL
jgi:MFS family permease